MLIWALLADTTTPSFSLPSVFEIYGPLGAVAGFGLWMTLSTITRLNKDKDELVKQRDEERQINRELERNLREQIIPLLSSNQTTTAEAVKVLDQVRYLLTSWLGGSREDPRLPHQPGGSP